MNNKYFKLTYWTSQYFEPHKGDIYICKSFRDCKNVLKSLLIEDWFKTKEILKEIDEHTWHTFQKSIWDLNFMIEINKFNN